jgi:hypothetical protein
MEEQQSEFWSSVSIKRSNDVDSLLVDPKPEPITKIVKQKSEKFLTTMSKEKVSPFSIIPENENIKLSEFISAHNDFGRSKTHLPVDQIKRFTQLGFWRALLKSSHGDLVGCILTKDIHVEYLLPDKIEKTRIGCSSFLALNKSFRNIGLASAVISLAIEIGADGNVHAGYHLIKQPKGLNAVPIRRWYIPIDIEECRRLLYVGLKYKSKRKDSKGKILKCEKDNDMMVSLSKYNEIIQGKKMKFVPDFEEWKKWCTNMSVYFSEDAVCICDFLTISNNGEDKTRIIVWILLLVGNVKNMLKYLSKVAEKKGCLLVFTHAVGDVTSEILQELNAVDTRDDSYLDFYNVGISAKPNEIYLPCI